MKLFVVTIKINPKATKKREKNDIINVYFTKRRKGYSMNTTKRIAAALGLCILTSVSVVGATFHPGDRGDQIVTIQQALSSKGYAVAADGDYGVSTQAAVRKFQEDQGLDSDGIVGAATYAALTGSSMPENDSVASAFVTKATADNEILLIQQALGECRLQRRCRRCFWRRYGTSVRSYQGAHGLIQTASSVRRPFMP